MPSSTGKTIVSSPSQVADGDLIGVTVAEGDFKAQVTGSERRPNGTATNEIEEVIADWTGEYGPV